MADLGDRADLLLDIGDAYDTASQLLDDTTTLLTPDPPGFPWLKLGLGLGGAAIVGAIAYRITRR